MTAPSIDAELRKASSPQMAYVALQDALEAFGTDQALHMRFFKGDLVGDLAPYITAALSGELVRRKEAKIEAEIEEHVSHLALTMADVVPESDMPALVAEFRSSLRAIRLSKPPPVKPTIP